MTLGEYRVGIDFNPGKNPAVDNIKRKAADLIDYIADFPPLNDPEIGRLKGLAMERIEEGAMWAVKFITKVHMK